MRPKRFRDSIGQALITVLAVITLLALLPAVVLQATNTAVPITLRAENQHAALAAAEAGAAVYFSHLSANPSYTRYNDVTCNPPSPADGFYLAGFKCAKNNGGSSSYSILASDLPKGDWVTVPNTSVQEAYVYTVTDPDPSNPRKSRLELIVTGRGGNRHDHGTVQYRTLKIDLTSQLTNAIFSNYNTASPYTYSNSEDFTILQDAVKLVLAAANVLTNYLTGGTLDGIDVSTVQQDINNYLGMGPVGNIKLAQLFCGYHSYQLNPVADLVQEALVKAPTLVNEDLEPYLGNFDPLGLPIGKYLLDAISDVTNVVTSALNWALFHENFLGESYLWTGPFPLVCNVSELYGYLSSNPLKTNRYYGLSTRVDGPVYSNDQFYTCTFGASSTALHGDKVQIGEASPLSDGSSSLPRILENPAPSGAFALDNLPQINFTIPIINWSFDVSTGCSTNTNNFVTLVASEPTPVPDFSAIREDATCNFYGPTFIDFQDRTAYIWSPDTPEMGGPGSGCGSGPENKYEYVVSNPKSGTGKVLYVNNLPEGEGKDCRRFHRPFVLPFGKTTPIQHHNCHWGDALVQGTYRGDWTIGAANDIVITGSVIANGSMEKKSMLGLAPGGNVPISEPYVGSSGVFYPQGNVVINHPVVNGENDNNCSFVTMPDGGSPEGLPSQYCSPPIPSPTSIVGPPAAQSCSLNINLDLPNAIIQYVECLLDVNFYEPVVHYMYNIVKAGYVCGVGSQAEAVFGLSNCTKPTSSGLYYNAGVSNDNSNAKGVVAASGRPPSPPKGCSSSSDWATSALPSGCVVNYFWYYWDFGSEAGTALDELCKLFSNWIHVSCDFGGYESRLATWEASWVHGPRNSFPAVYKPEIDADIIASNSSSKVTWTPVGELTPSNITNGSFTVQNVDSGNSGSYLRDGHGLGKLTVNGAIVESYADGLANAGLTMNHFHILDSGCKNVWNACYVASGYHKVDINYNPGVVLNPPPDLVKEALGVEWVSRVQELSVNKVLIGI